jgi:hypothetical protein
MAQRFRKISLAQARRQGDTVVIFDCVTEREGQPAPYGGGPNVCGHHSELDIDAVIARFGAETPLDAVRAVCTVCGGRSVDVRGRGPQNLNLRLF